MITKTWKKPVLLLMVLVIALCAFCAGITALADGEEQEPAAETKVTSIKCANGADTIDIYFSAGQVKTRKPNFEGNIGSEGFEAFSNNLLINGKTIAQLKAEGAVGRVDCHLNYAEDTSQYSIRLGLFKSNAAPWGPFDFVAGTTISFLEGLRRPMWDGSAFTLETSHEIKARQDFYLPSDISAQLAWKVLGEKSLLLNIVKYQELLVGDTLDFDVQSPAGLTDVTFSSDNTDVATINAATGELTAVGAGTAIITAASGKRRASVPVYVDAEQYTGTKLTFTTTSIAYVGGEPWAVFPNNHAHNTPTDMANVETTSAKYTEDKFNGFYDYILVNGKTYKQFAFDNKGALGIRFCGSGEPKGFRIGSPVLTNGMADVTITFLRGFSPLVWKDGAFEVDTTYRLNKSITFVTRKAGSVWTELSEPTDLKFFASPDKLKVGQTGAVAAYAIRPYFAPALANEVTYSSSDPSVVEVNEQTGAYTVRKGGNVKILAHYGDVSRAINYTVDSAVSLDKNAISLRVNGTETLTATIATGLEDTLTVSSWTSSAPNVATVENGVVTGVSAGEATVTVTLSNGDTATCTVTVSEGDSVTVSADKTAIKFTEEVALSVVTNSESDIVWSVSDAGGIFEAEKGKTNKFIPGKCGTFTVTATIEGTEVSDTVEITVSSVISLGVSSEKIRAGETYKITPSVQPEDMTYTYSSSKTSVATVDENGVVTGVGAGKATITVTTADGQKADMTITVFVEKTTSVDRALMTDANTFQLLFTESPYTVAGSELQSLEKIAGGDNVIPEALRQFFEKIKINGVNYIDFWSWTERDYDVNMHLSQVVNLLNMPCYVRGSDGATGYAYPTGTTIILEQGMILPEKVNGEWRLSGYVLDKTYAYEIMGGGAMTAATVTGVSFKDASVNIAKGGEKTLELDITGNKYLAASLGYAFTSSDENVVTVDADGKIVAVNNGTATVTVTLGAFSATVSVKVGDETTVSFKDAKVEVVVGKSKKLTVNVNPQDTALAFTSSDESIVTVDAEGNITGNKVGTAIVTVTTADGKTATVSVTVKEEGGCGSDVSATSAVSVAVVLLAACLAAVLLKKRSDIRAK